MLVLFLRHNDVCPRSALELTNHIVCDVRALENMHMCETKQQNNTPSFMIAVVCEDQYRLFNHLNTGIKSLIK